jgi:hypothetical protein
MNRRHTIILDEKIEEHLRRIQINMIRESSESVSFSFVINLVLSDGLLKRKQKVVEG